MLSIIDIEAAAGRLAGTATRTPVITNAAIDALAGAAVFLKAENLQVTGAFKFRGAFNSVAMLSPDELDAGVVTFSSGNHAQAVARAASLRGSTATIVMPLDAPAAKVAATNAAGGTIVTYDRYTGDRAAIAKEIAEREGRVMIPPYDHQPVMAGQGTVGLELCDQVQDLDAMFVCLGGGGLLAGCATAAAAMAPNCQIYGVEPSAGDDHVRSRAAGERVTIDVPRTIADGQMVTAPGELTWPINNELAAGFVTVTDEQIVDTMRVLFSEAKLVVEPSGASALASVLYGDHDLAGARIGVTLSGGNIGLERFMSIVGSDVS